MTSEFQIQFLLWSLGVNYAILFVWFFVFICARGWVRKLHGKWFSLSETTFDAIHYGGMGIYKIGIVLLNLTPLLALCLVGNGP